MNRFIGFIEGWEKPYSHFGAELQRTGYVWGTHYLPHDAEHKRQQGSVIASPLDELSKLAIGGSWDVVERIPDLQHGIQMTRAAFSTYYFDEAACKDGLIHLAGYKKKWNRSAGAWSDEPLKNKHTEAADALRQHAQGFAAPIEREREERKRRANSRNWKTR